MNNTRLDSELPNKMASLDIFDSNNAAPVDESPSKRILRKRTQSPKKQSAVTNRRVKMKPKKLKAAVIGEEELKKLYSEVTVGNAASQSLETIFEEPKSVNDTLLLIGGKKIKRSLKFHEASVHTKEKIKKRRSKIKRLLGNKNFTNRKKMSMQAFLETLRGIEADDDEDAPVTRSESA